VTDALQLYVAPILPKSWRAEAMLALMLTSAGGVFLVAPVALVRIWRTSSLPEGPTRRELESMRDALGLRWRDLRVWHSGGTIANAGVMGLIAPLRYVLLSDVLLDRMDAHHVAAIFAHEAGHVVHKHILYAATFAIASVLLCGAAAEGLIRWLDWPAWAGEAIVLGMLAAVWGLAFGWLSRRFERQSDVLAAWAAGGSDPQGRITHEGALVFAESLHRVGQLNGIAPDQWNWRHGSIGQRIQYVLNLAADEGDRGAVDRGVARVKWVLRAGLLAALGVTVWQTWAWS
jgi:STE24 endopeptidase